MTHIKNISYYFVIMLLIIFSIITIGLFLCNVKKKINILVPIKSNINNNIHGFITIKVPNNINTYNIMGEIYQLKDGIYNLYIYKYGYVKDKILDPEDLYMKKYKNNKPLCILKSTNNYASFNMYKSTIHIFGQDTILGRSFVICDKLNNIIAYGPILFNK